MKIINTISHTVLFILLIFHLPPPPPPPSPPYHPPFLPIPSPRPGIPIKTTLDNPSTVQYAGLIHQLVMKARSTVRDIDPQNDLTFLRVRSKKNEVMIAPGRLLTKSTGQTV